MRLDTYRFGEIEVNEEKLLRFSEGIPGFESLTRFVILTTEETEPFHWLQSADDPMIALAVINPFELLPDYSPRVNDSVFEELEAQNEDDIICLTVAVIPEDIEKVTLNLASPVLINTKKNLGKQVILEGSDYSPRFPVFEGLRKKMEEAKGGPVDAGADAQD